MEHNMSGFVRSVVNFLDAYSSIHVTLVTIMCCVGVGGHVVVICVLTRQVTTNAFNYVLTSMSVCQFVLLQSFLYFTYNTLYAEIECQTQFWSFGWVLSRLVSVELSVVMHTLALFHLAILSIARYITISKCRHLVSGTWFTMGKALVSCGVTYVAVPLLCVPVYLTSTVTPVLDQQEARGYCNVNWTEGTSYHIKFSKLAQTLYQFNFWFYAIACKLVPCAFFSIMTIMLAWKLHCLEHSLVSISSSRKRKYKQTTWLILTVMVLFVAVELPQALLNMAAAVLKSEFFWFYQKANDFMEMLSVAYSSINFSILCFMSEQFRANIVRQLRRLFCRRSQSTTRSLLRATTPRPSLFV